MTGTAKAYATVEQAVRDCYGRLVAYLAVHWRDVAAAEDALADAFLAACETWPRQGVPDKPEAWLLTAARRRLVDGARRARVQAKAVPELLALAEEGASPGAEWEEAEIGDERLRMLFLCAHPELDPGIRTPLVLQTVLGVDATRIATAFVVKPATMGQRLSRAKAKLRAAPLRFEMPEKAEWPGRLEAVLEAVYAAYGSGWEEAAGAEPRRRDLAAEAIHLGRLLVRFLPGEPEAQGLLALMLHLEARRAARRDAKGRYIPLSEQDVTLWSADEIGEAEHHLSLAARAGRMGRFQLEAAIQSVHAHRSMTGETAWEDIALLYEGLVRLAPTLGAQVGRAAALAEAQGAQAGLSLLGELPQEAVRSYQPFWALAAHLYGRVGRLEEAREAYSRAAGLSTDPSVRRFLQERMNGL
ncbi:sigma factor [Paenibacillus aurantius]|uniref:Sigma factor n=1 Tax=Paenibacillus aurantius TaxID=2918900 RepID=A0AA96REY0_9BACL|nr:DUF6596 domain-containing protein [Paenibacillus aurantius]WNQ10901.1 sigma factor [Paenibacillus aurantius]